MARRSKGLLDAVVAMPWPIGIVLGIAAFLVVRYGISWYFSASSSALMQGVGKQFATNHSLTPLAWGALALFWTGALFSWIGQRKRNRLLAGQTGVESLGTMSWREFEMLVGEAFRRRGYAVEETGLGGADGGVDLILRKDGRRELVQCKINVSVVREMWGLAAHHRVDAVKIVCAGRFTADAEGFARGKPIELIDGQALAALIREVQDVRQAKAAATPNPAMPSCPACGSAMVVRRNRISGDSFLGCSTFPRCRHTAKSSRPAT